MGECRPVIAHYHFIKALFSVLGWGVCGMVFFCEFTRLMKKI